MTNKIKLRLKNRIGKLTAIVSLRPKKIFIRECIKYTSGATEDAYLAETAYEEFLKSGSDSISLEDVERKLGFAD